MSASTGFRPEACNATLDLFERVVVSVLLTMLAMRFVPSIVLEGNLANLLLFGAEAIVVGFIVFRRPATSISRNPGDWLSGFAGTVLGLAVMPGGGDDAIAPLSLVVFMMLCGFVLQVWAKLSLRRSFGVVAANRGVKATGAYQLVRHPMYAGYILTQIGFVLAAPSAWNLAAYLSLWAMQILRIAAEERILREDPAYRAFAEQVRWRLLPGVY